MRCASNGTDDVRPACSDDVRAEGEVGHELAVHDVPLDEVDAGLLERDALLAEACEVRGEHRRRDADRRAAIPTDDNVTPLPHECWCDCGAMTPQRPGVQGGMASGRCSATNASRARAQLSQ